MSSTGEKDDNRPDILGLEQWGQADKLVDTSSLASSVKVATA
jgi:hypothetical protein